MTTTVTVKTRGYPALVTTKTKTPGENGGFELTENTTTVSDHETHTIHVDENTDVTVQTLTKTPGADQEKGTDAGEEKAPRSRKPEPTPAAEA